jgi:RNA polymerase sigma factor (sigma-70 family)
MKSVVRYLRRVAVHQAGELLTDGQLLEAFLTVRDEAAFEALLRRHGPMVMGVCRRALANPQDAEDAFQATFLVLVRKAATIRPRALVGNWLYGVACRTARRAQAMNIRRQIKERQACPKTACAEECDPGRDELLRHLDVELSRLPDKYRVPVVLCELEGKSRKEAARLLGLAEGTLSWRLARARKLLAGRMARRGVALSAASLALSLSGKASASVPLTLLHSTARVSIQVAGGRALTAAVASARVITLTEGVLKAMLMSKLKMIWTVSLAVTLAAGASGLTYRAVAAGPSPTSDPVPQVRGDSDELEALRSELEALRRSLQATRQRVISLENDMKKLALDNAQARPPAVGGEIPAGPSAAGMMGGGAMGSFGSRMMGGRAMGGPGLAPGGASFTPRDGAAADFFPKRGGMGPACGMTLPRGGGKFGGGLPGAAANSPDPLAQAEEALKELRQNPDSKSAMAQLNQALLQLRKKQAEPESVAPKDEPRR